ncbi:MAG: 30S ribosomal protein S11 [Fibromonadaceae bacterium]|nr:30S ribosomal protein S11 [Fibromonadaceae bacterium]
MAEEEVKEEKEPAAEVAAEVKVKKGKKRIDVQGIAHIFASFNNTIISITDSKGNLVSFGSPGRSGYKGSKKSTPYAAQVASEAAALQAFSLGVRKVTVRIKGAGPARESAVRALKNAGLEVLSILDVTGIPHNGCRPKKRRRI